MKSFIHAHIPEEPLNVGSKSAVTLDHVLKVVLAGKSCVFIQTEDGSIRLYPGILIENKRGRDTSSFTPDFIQEQPFHCFLDVFPSQCYFSRGCSVHNG